jgi:hypothetical protein
MKSDREWCELELQYCLLHELMHQHEYSLCAEGRVAFGDLPGVLRQAYASSMAREILRRAGAGNEALELVRDWDGCSPETQAFDDFRLQSGLTPDEALLYLASHPDEAKLLPKRAYIRSGYPAGPLVFEYAGRSTAGNALVTVVNASPSSCSVYSTGWWHMTARGARGPRYVGSTPFGLRLPPGGRVTLVTGMRIRPEDTVESVELDYSLTPAPVFGE